MLCWLQRRCKRREQARAPDFGSCVSAFTARACGRGHPRASLWGRRARVSASSGTARAPFSTRPFSACLATFGALLPERLGSWSVGRAEISSWARREASRTAVYIFLKKTRERRVDNNNNEKNTTWRPRRGRRRWRRPSALPLPRHCSWHDLEWFRSPYPRHPLHEEGAAPSHVCLFETYPKLRASTRGVVYERLVYNTFQTLCNRVSFLAHARPESGHCNLLHTKNAQCCTSSRSRSTQTKRLPCHTKIGVRQKMVREFQISNMNENEVNAPAASLRDLTPAECTGGSFPWLAAA